MHQSSIKTWLNESSNAQSHDNAVDITQPTTASPNIEGSRVSPEHVASTPSQYLNPVTVAPFTRQPALPPNVEFCPVTKENLAQFRRLISLVLPVSYGDSFYSAVLNDATTSKLTLAAYWKDDSRSEPRMVAAISGNIITDCHDARIGTYARTTPTLYISTLGTLSPYRGHGLAEALIQAIHRIAINEFKT